MIPDDLFKSIYTPQQQEQQQDMSHLIHLLEERSVLESTPAQPIYNDNGDIVYVIPPKMVCHLPQFYDEGITQ